MKKNNIILLLSLMLVSLQAAAQPEITRIRQNEDSVLKYDKYEVRFDIDADYENPFDPQEIEVNAVFTSPSGKEWLMPGFYNYSHWSTMWMVRFSPDETGTWSYVIRIKDKNGEMESETYSFLTIPSSYHGPIRVAENHRYLVYDDGTPYYGVGLWYNDGYAAFNEGRIKPEELDNLKELGVNYISTYITPLETWGTGMGRYDQNIAGRIDEVLEMCEEREMILSLNIWFHSYLSKEVWGGGNSRWNSNPYQLVCDVGDFFSDEEAWKYQEKLYRYFIARWGYSRSLGIWFIVDEVNGTEGWVNGDSVAAATWGRKIHEYFKNNDPYQHLTTGTRSGGIDQWWQRGYEVFDLPGREIYEAQGFPIINTGTVKEAETHPLTHSYRNYGGEVTKLWNGFEKPAIIPETGWDHTFYEMEMPGYQAQYHNALWVSLANGASMTPFWWAHSNRLNDNVLTKQLLNFRRFVNQIPFSKLTNLKKTEASLSDGDAYAISSDQVIFGWVANSRTDVVGETVTLSSIKPGKYRMRLYHTWRGEFIEDSEIESNGNTISFDLPVLKIQGSHARYVGQDAAFIVEPVD